MDRAGSTMPALYCIDVTCRLAISQGEGFLTEAELFAHQRQLLEAVLPLHRYSIEEALELVGWVQRRNYQVYRSHRKRWQGEG